MVRDFFSSERQTHSDQAAVRYDVATQNMTSSRVPTKEMVLFAADNHNITESNLVLHEALVIGFSVAATLRVIGWLTTAAGLVSTGLGCYEVIEGAVGGEQTTAKSKASCVLGKLVSMSHSLAHPSPLTPVHAPTYISPSF